MVGENEIVLLILTFMCVLLTNTKDTVKLNTVCVENMTCHDMIHEMKNSCLWHPYSVYYEKLVSKSPDNFYVYYVTVEPC